MFFIYYRFNEEKKITANKHTGRSGRESGIFSQNGKSLIVGSYEILANEQ